MRVLCALNGYFMFFWSSISVKRSCIKVKVKNHLEKITFVFELLLKSTVFDTIYLQFNPHVSELTFNKHLALKMFEVTETGDHVPNQQFPIWNTNDVLQFYADMKIVYML